MALADIQPVIDPPHSGGGGLGGLIGSIVGGLAGVALAPFTAGASLAADLAVGAGGAAVGMGLGNTVGSLSGEAVDPSSGGSSTAPLGHDQGSAPAQRAPLRAAATASPEFQLAGLQDAKQAISTSTLPESDANAYLDQINQAQGVLKKRMGIGSSVT